jgi:hypothetical protein
MTDTIATVDTNGYSVTATVGTDSTVLFSSTNLANPATLQSLSDIGNVDTSTNGLTNGSILIYKTTTNMWTSSTTLDAQNMEGGEF